MSNKKQSSETTNDVSNGNEIAIVKSIFDDDMLEKTTDADGKRRWQCLWCNQSFGGWNATKALFHVARQKGNNVSVCPSLSIDSEHKKLYQELLARHSTKKANNQAYNVCVSNSIDQHHNNVASTHVQQKKRFHGSSVHVSSSLPSSLAESATKRPKVIEIPSTISSSKSSLASSDVKSFADSSKKEPSYLQLKVHDGSNPLVESKLTMAIADWIHSSGYAFNAASDPKFRRIVSLARAVGSNYTPPDRNAVGGKLLDLNYEQYIEDNMKKLCKDSAVYGLSLMGDGATVKKMPLLNILASGFHLYSTVLEIVDCTEHMAAGGVKDARYIASLFVSYIEKLEDSQPNCVDMVLFDGAANVQKAADILSAKFPRIIAYYGNEHVLSLLFQDLFKRKELRALYGIVRATYGVFGSGAMHAPYAMFHQYSKIFNGGRNIGLFKDAGTRFAGRCIAMLRMLRLQDAIKATINSSEFQSKKVCITYD